MNLEIIYVFEHVPFVAPQTVDQLPPFLYGTVPPIQVIFSPFQPLDRCPVFLTAQPVQSPSPRLVQCCQEFPLVIHLLFVRVLND